MEVIIEGVDLPEKIKQLRVKDDKVIKVVKEIKQTGVKMLRDEEWREVNSIMYKEGKVYMSKNNILRIEIIRLHYDILVGGYGEQWKIVKLVTRNFWWSEITKEVKRYMEECSFCQRNKNHIE